MKTVAVETHISQREPAMNHIMRASHGSSSLKLTFTDLMNSLPIR